MEPYILYARRPEGDGLGGRIRKTQTQFPQLTDGAKVGWPDKSPGLPEHLSWSGLLAEKCAVPDLIPIVRFSLDPNLQNILPARVRGWPILATPKDECTSPHGCNAQSQDHGTNQIKRDA